MNDRRNFLKLASSAAIPAAAAIVSSGAARADDGSVQQFLGSWTTKHTLPTPPYPAGSFFREFLSFADGGVLHETNAFLHTASNTPGLLPNDVVNASDGVGNWERVRNGVIQVTFRKMLFNGSRVNFGDLHVTGTAQSDGTNLHAVWHIEILGLDGTLLATLGDATSQGTRLG
jgi:hypothetical protein